MKANKFWKYLLMSGLLLALPASAGCGRSIQVHSPAGQIRFENPVMQTDADAIRVCFQGGDSQEVCGRLGPDGQLFLDNAGQPGGVVDLGRLMEQNLPAISVWSFESAQVYAAGGGLRGSLDGGVVYADGRSGKLRLEFEQAGDTWKLRSSTPGE